MKARTKYGLVILLIFLSPLFSWAQKTTTLRVIGKSNYLDPEMIYKASVILSTDLAGDNREGNSLNHLKTLYDETLKKKGFSLDMLHEQEIKYVTRHISAEGTIYEFTTLSLNDFKKFISIKSIGVERDYLRTEMRLNEDKASQIKKMALENAALQARTLANAMGKQLGDILSVEEPIPITQDKNVSTYFGWPIEGYAHKLVVTYALE